MLEMTQARRAAGKDDDRADLFSLLMSANEKEEDESPLTDTELISECGRLVDCAAQI
jgi:cytochrome P450